jgi:hypothetical protein
MKTTPSKKFNTTKKPSEVKTSQNKKRKSPPKSTPEVNYKNQVKEMFSNWFKKNNQVGYIMSKQDVVANILTKLTSKQENSFEIAIKELHHDGYIELQEDGLTIVLTQKGVNDFKKMSF